MFSNTSITGLQSGDIICLHFGANPKPRTVTFGSVFFNMIVIRDKRVLRFRRELAFTFRDKFEEFEEFLDSWLGLKLEKQDKIELETYLPKDQFELIETEYGMFFGRYKSDLDKEECKEAGISYTEVHSFKVVPGEL